MPDATTTPRIQTRTLRRVLASLRGYRAALAFSLLLAIATVALTLYVPVVLGNAIDRILGPGHVDFPAVLHRLLLLGAAVGATALLQWLMNAVNNRVAYHVTRDLRRQTFEKIQNLPLAYLDAHPTGDVLSRVITDADQVADGLLMGFSQLFTGFVSIAGTLAFMLALRWQIALVVLCVTPLSLFVARFVSRRTYRMFRLQSETRGEQTAMIDETLNQQKVVQAFGHEQATLAAFDEVNGRLADSSLKAT